MLACRSLRMLSKYVVESVTERAYIPPQHRQSSIRRLPQIETNLIQKINQSLSQIEWQRQAEALTPDEQVELIALSDQIEEANVKRIEYVAELAKIRQTTIPAMMKELGLKPMAHA